MPLPGTISSVSCKPKRPAHVEQGAAGVSPAVHSVTRQDAGSTFELAEVLTAQRVFQRQIVLVNALLDEQEILRIRRVEKILCGLSGSTSSARLSSWMSRPTSRSEARMEPVHFSGLQAAPCSDHSCGTEYILGVPPTVRLHSSSHQMVNGIRCTICSARRRYLFIQVATQAGGARRLRRFLVASRFGIGIAENPRAGNCAR